MRLGAIAKRYLSRAHRDMLDTGCPMPATLSEIARAGAPAKRALTEAIDSLVRELAAKVPGDDASERRSRVIATLALCYGGLALARAVDDEKLSHEILKACRRAATTAEER